MKRTWSRRSILAAGAALAASGRASSAHANASPPIARRVDVVDTYFGESVADPYRWMEDPSDPDWLPYLRGQTAFAQRQLDQIPGRPGLRASLERFANAVTSYREVQRSGGRTVYAQVLPDAHSAKLLLFEQGASEPRVVFDPASVTSAEGAVLDWWRLAPNGRHIVVGVSLAGREDSTAYVVNTDSGVLLPERFSRASFGFVSWLADSSGFFITRFVDGRSPTDLNYFSGSACWLHRLGEDPANDISVFRPDMPGVDEDERLVPEVREQPGSDYVIGVVFYTEAYNPVFVARRSDVLAGQPHWVRVTDRGDQVAHNTMSNVGVGARGERLYLLSNRDAPNGRVISVPIAQPDIALAQVEIEESALVLESFFLAEDGVYTRDLEAGYAKMRFKPWASARVRRMRLPVEGALLDVAPQIGGGLIIVVTTWLEPASAWLIGPHARSRTRLLPEHSSSANASYALRREMIRARDGESVPISIIAPRNARRAGPRPALVYVYGAAGLIFTPAYDPAMLAFLEAGGIVAVAHVRGGGELGRRWAEAADGIRKVVSYRDLIDCCEALIAGGWTTPERLALTGASGAGMVLGMALTERPDLFAAVIPEVATLNWLRFGATANGQGGVGEDFSTETEAGYRASRAVDGYSHVVEGVAYPGVLLLHGANDIRVPAWQSAKMCAALQYATRSTRPVLMRIDFDSGHGVGEAGPAYLQKSTDLLSFALWQTGAAGFQPNSLGR